MVGSVRFKASTLVETIVAILIITVVFGISLSIYDNVVLSDRRMRKERALVSMDLKIQEVVSEPLKFRNHVTHWKEEGFTIDLDVQEPSGYKKVLVLKVMARDFEGKVIANRIKVIQYEKN